MDQTTILIVEDNNANRMVFQDLLEAEGYHVVAVPGAEDALSVARDIMPDLILMDIQLQGMDGLTATRKLREDHATRAIPIVAVTSHAMPKDRERTLVAGCNGYITKPIRVKEFRREIATYVASVVRVAS